MASGWKFMYKWLFFFYVYSFLGWCFESVYVSAKSGRWVNRGFMRGPFLPIYGGGAVMMLVVSAPFQDNIALTYLAGCLGATALEYIVGTVTEMLFRVRYWDYTGKFMNFEGQICLSSTIAWGFFTVLMTKGIHKPIAQFAGMLPGGLLAVVTIILTAYVSADISLSFKAALDMRDVLARLEGVKQEMERLQKRMDVLIAVAGQAASEERHELHMKFRVMHDRRRQLKLLHDFYKRQLLLDNPGMISARFKNALEELKEAAKAHEKEYRNEIHGEKAD